MEVINSRNLLKMIDENKKEMEGLFPELIKRLIISSCKKISAIRIPSLDDVWAPGFDGIITCDEQSTYVAKGNSVWEIGTNADSLQKVESDFAKRDEDSLGIDKTETSFYLVVPYIWAYNNQGWPISKWETSHKGVWKELKVYDASIICDWINSEPSVCAWLFDQIEKDDFHDFSSVSSAWKNLRNYTNPPFSSTMFLNGRDNEVDVFLEKVKSPLCIIKADTLIGARGFVLAALMQDKELSQTCIVVNNEKTYKSISSIVTGKPIFLNFNFEGELKNGNHLIICRNREGASVKDEIELPMLTKSAFKRALRDMNISSVKCEELFAFTHGNLRTLIRRIRGSYYEEKPDWEKYENKDCLVPLVLMRAINRKNDAWFAEKMTGLSFSEVEKQYAKLLKIEDTPIKKVNDNYVIVNYEEAWEILNLSESELYLEKLTNVICEMLVNLSDSNGDMVNRRLFSNMSSLFLNYVYFSSCISDELIYSSINKILAYIYKDGCRKTILGHLSILAEACPEAILDFLNRDIESDESITTTCFYADKYSDDYCHILFALEELMLVKETIVGAFRILIYLYDINREYTIANSPEDTLLSSLSLGRTEGTSNLNQKKELLLTLLDKKQLNYATLAIKLVNQDSFAVGVRLGQRRVEGDPITYGQLSEVRNAILSKVVDIAYEFGNGTLIIDMLEHYFIVNPANLLEYATQFNKDSFCQEDMHSINYCARDRLFSIKRFKWKESRKYIKPLQKWIEMTTDADEIDASDWIYRDSYDCPALELLSTCDNYKIESSAKHEYRKNCYLNLEKKYGKAVLKRIISYMSDEGYWGRFIAEVTISEEFDYCVEAIASTNKYNILCAFLDCCDVECAKKYVFSCEKEKRRTILGGLSNYDVVADIEDEDALKAFWKTEQIIEYDEVAYSALLKFYPENLIGLLSVRQIKNSHRYIDMVKEVFTALLEKEEIEIRHDLANDLEDVMQAVDSIFYSDEWAVLCIKMYVRDFVPSFSEAARKYIFAHPEEIKKLIEEEKINGYSLLHAYKLPKSAYLDYASFKHFFFELRKILNDEKGYYIGSILGKTKDGADGLFPHEFTMRILEEFADKGIDKNVYIAYCNDKPFRAVVDGSDQKLKMEKYKNKAIELEIRYPHTASILNMLSNDYEENAKYEYEYSEIDLF